MRATTPLLLVIAGPARGRAVPLDGLVSIGRDERSAIVIPDLALSRRHCELEPTGEGVVLRDLASRNGSWVNGVPVTHHVLTDGDRIRIGDSAFLFVAAAHGDEAEPPIPLASFDDATLPSPSTVAVAFADTWYSRTTQTPDTPIDARRAARDLAALLRVSDALQRTTSRHELHARVLAHALEMVAADAAAIITLDDATGELAVAAVDRRNEIAITIGRTMASKALAERVAMLANDVDAEPLRPGAVTQAATPVRGALCVPLLTADEPACAIYLMNGPGKPRFTDHDLQLLAGIGSIGGLAVDRLRHVEWLEHENSRLRTDEAIDHQMIGESAALKDVFQFVARAAPTEATVLIRRALGGARCDRCAAR